MSKQSDDGAQTLVYKIVAAEAWHTAFVEGSFSGSNDDQRDGFIHLSDATQVADTYQKYFRQQDGLLLVAFESVVLDPYLKWEVSRGGALFPHYYAALPAHLALWQRQIVVQADGSIPAFEGLS